MNPAIFREYDIRGVADRDLGDADATLLGRAVGTVAIRAGARRFGLGRDCRLHSPRIREAVLRGLLDCGLDVVDVGLCATPLLYFAVHHRDLDGGVMVTGSHNPAADNGLKILVGKAALHGEGIREIRTLVEHGDFEKRPPGYLEEAPVLDEYVDFVVNGVRPGRALRVAVDAGNGPAGLAALPILRRLGHDVVELYCEPDGRFPHHHPDPTVEENLADLVETVRSRGCDLGIAYDGDGDRLGAVDETGRILWGDQLMIVFTRALLAEGKSGPFIGDVKCSSTLYDDVRARGGEILMWKTGHSLIKQKMKEEKAILAGEMSGHIFFADRYFGYDDAIYASIRLVEILSASEAPASGLLADVPPTVFTPEIRVDCPDDRKFEIVERLRKRFAARYETVAIDGARFRVPGGWGLVRASNTQPVLVLRFEANDEATLQALRTEVEEALRDITAPA